MELLDIQQLDRGDLPRHVSQVLRRFRLRFDETVTAAGLDMEERVMLAKHNRAQVLGVR